jgi:hypothetical protein
LEDVLYQNTLRELICLFEVLSHPPPDGQTKDFLDNVSILTLSELSNSVYAKSGYKPGTRLFKANLVCEMVSPVRRAQISISDDSNGISIFRWPFTWLDPIEQVGSAARLMANYQSGERNSALRDYSGGSSETLTTGLRRCRIFFSMYFLQIRPQGSRFETTTRTIRYFQRYAPSDDAGLL